MSIVTAAAAEAVANGEVLEGVTIRLVEGDTLQLTPGMTLRDAVFESHRPITLQEFSFADVTLERVRFRNVSFAYGSFDRSTFSHVHFGSNLGDRTAVPVRFEAVTFRACTFEWTNFKNVTFVTCNFKESSFDYCDFYHARILEGCVFETAAIRLSSLWRTDITGSDLSVINVAGPDRKGYLLQEQPVAFTEYHAGEDKVIDPVRREAVLAAADSEAIDIYSSLAGHFSSRGHGADEAWAFIRRKKLEMRVARKSGHWLKYLALLVAWLVTGFGESLGRVAATGLLLVVTVSLIFYFGYDQKWYLALAIGLAGLFGSRPASMPDALLHDLVADLTLVTETVLGILLVGIFGFILGNKIRGR